jgi:hypothetical protein
MSAADRTHTLDSWIHYGKEAHLQIGDKSPKNQDKLSNLTVVFLHLCLALKKAAKIMFLCLLGAELSNFE